MRRRENVRGAWLSMAEATSRVQPSLSFPLPLLVTFYTKLSQCRYGPPVCRKFLPKHPFSGTTHKVSIAVRHSTCAMPLDFGHMEKNQHTSTEAPAWLPLVLPDVSLIICLMMAEARGPPKPRFLLPPTSGPISGHEKATCGIFLSSACSTWRPIIAASTLGVVNSCNDLVPMSWAGGGTASCRAAPRTFPTTGRGGRDEGVARRRDGNTDMPQLGRSCTNQPVDVFCAGPDLLIKRNGDAPARS